MDSSEIISTKRKRRNTHKTNTRIQEQKQKQAEAEPQWINMTEEIRNGFLEAVAKMHDIDLKQARDLIST